MQKILIAFLCGALVASGVWIWIGRGAIERAEDAISEIQSQRDRAVESANNIKSELNHAQAAIGNLKAEIAERDRKYRILLDSLTVASDSLGDGVREYGQINRDFARFIAENTESEQVFKIRDFRIRNNHSYSSGNNFSQLRRPKDDRWK